MFFKVLTLLKLMFSDGIGGRLKALASTKLKVEMETVNQATACVRTAHTLHVGFKVSCNSQVGCVAQPRTRLVGYAGYDVLNVVSYIFSLLTKILHIEFNYTCRYILKTMS